MAEQHIDVSRIQRQNTVMVNVILVVLVLAFFAVFGGIGAGVAHLAHRNPPWDARVHIGIALFFLGLGLFRQFRLAAYGPKTPAVNRIQESVANSALALLGVSQLISDNFIDTPIAAAAVILMLAAAFRRPRKFFSSSTLT